MKRIALGCRALFVAAILFSGVGATGQSVQGDSATSAPRHASVATFSARPPTDDGARELGGSHQDPITVTVTVHPMSVPVTSMVTQQFTATVTGIAKKGVNWYVDGVAGGNPTVGTIDTTGLYTPPANFVIGSHAISAVSQVYQKASGSAMAYLVGFKGLYTNQNDNSRTGQNLQETVLTPQNVNVNTFGKLFSFAIDGQINAQPLYVANVNVPSPLNGIAGYHNVLYVVTANDSVYAYDADGKVKGGPLWKASFIDPPSVVPVPGSCIQASSSIIGITPTPVIDPATNTIYVEARTLEGQTTACSGTYVHRLHALDITTGQEKFGGPVVIQASVAGTGEGSSGGVLAFDPQRENSRPGLLLSQSAQDVNSVVYFATASNEDTHPFHGWILGYDSQTLAQKYVFCSTPDGGAGGVWQGGGGLAADSDGNIFVQTGNGTFDVGDDFGSSVLMLAPNNGSLGVADFYTPSDYATLNSYDWDISSGGLLLLPDQPGIYPHLMIGGGKEGTIYVINRDSLGGYESGGDNIVQYIVGAIKASVNKLQTFGIWNTPTYFQGNVYISGMGDYPKMFTLSHGLLPVTAKSTGPSIMRAPGTVISANGSENGIVWLFDASETTPILWAFSPSDLTQEYYDTNQNPTRDKISTRKITRVNPAVANGRVYVPTNTSIVVYGLLQ